MKPKRPAKPLLVNAVCDAIRKIPRGRVSTYGAIAAAAGYPRCARHVGRVLKRVSGLPWQRVLGSGGRISLRGESALEQRLPASNPKGCASEAGGWTCETLSTGLGESVARLPVRSTKDYGESNRQRSVLGGHGPSPCLKFVTSLQYPYKAL